MFIASAESKLNITIKDGATEQKQYDEDYQYAYAKGIQ
jgi:hypothetical protein